MTWHAGVVPQREPLATLRAVWEESGDPLPVNQILVQAGLAAGDQATDGLIYLTFGHSNPPPVFGDADQRVLMIEALHGVLPVRVVGHFVVSRARAQEFHKLLGEYLEQTETGNA